MRLRKKKSFIEQARDQASDYVDAVKPQLESAFHTAVDTTVGFVETTALPLLVEARDKASEGLHEAREKAGPALADARAKAGPALADARDKATPYLADARDKATPYLADARDKARDAASPYLSEARDKAAPYLSEARDKAAPVIDRAAPVLADAKAKAAPLVAGGAALAADKAGAAKHLADAKVAQLKGEPAPRKGSRLKKIALLAILAAVIGVVAKKLQGGRSEDNWQSSYVPAPPPAPSASTTAASAAASAAAADDASGSSPDEALADAVEAPHPVTTPDQPAEVVDISDPLVDGAAPEDEPTDGSTRQP